MCVNGSARSVTNKNGNVYNFLTIPWEDLCYEIHVERKDVSESQYLQICRDFGFE